MLPSYMRTDPAEAFKRKWEWHEIPWEAAVMRCSFVPVVMVSNSSGPCQVTWLSPRGLHGLPIIPHFQQRYFVQVGTGKAPTAISPVRRTMALSQDGMDFIGKGYENPREKGLDRKTGRYTVYDDGYGNDTIGYGHVVLEGEDFGKGLTLQEVQRLFIRDGENTVSILNQQLKVGVSQNQFDAIVSMCYNVPVKQKAPGWTSKHHVYRPTLPVRRLNQGLAVREEDFTIYAHARDKHKGNQMGKSSGLLKRRKAEWRIFKDGVYDARH